MDCAPQTAVTTNLTPGCSKMPSLDLAEGSFEMLVARAWQRIGLHLLSQRGKQEYREVLKEFEAVDGA